jgi:hypothetical protein
MSLGRKSPLQTGPWGPNWNEPPGYDTKSPLIRGNNFRCGPTNGDSFFDQRIKVDARALERKALRYVSNVTRTPATCGLVAGGEGAPAIDVRLVEV